MNSTEKLKLLQDWVDNFHVIGKVYDELRSLYSCDPDCKVLKALYDGFDNYTKTLSMLLGDKHEWLDWYIWENECGKKKLKVSLNGGKEFKITNLKNLLDCVEAYLEPE